MDVGVDPVRAHQKAWVFEDLGLEGRLEEDAQTFFKVYDGKCMLAREIDSALVKTKGRKGSTKLIDLKHP